MFNQCDFLLGDNESIIIVVPTQLPKSEPLTVEVHRENIVFRCGEDEIAQIDCPRRDIKSRLANRGKVGLIEFLNGIPQFPAYITAVANIEVMLEAA